MFTDPLISSSPPSVGPTDPGPAALVAPVRRWIEDHPSLIVFLLVLVAVTSALLLKNRGLLDRPIDETGDAAANSIIVKDAKQFELLVGNYSRQQFSHPGPAAFYIQGAGEYLFHDVFGLVPKPYNGQALAVLVWNAAIVAMVVALIYRISGSLLAALSSLAAILAFASEYGKLLSDTWMPYYYFAPFLLLLVAAGVLVSGDPWGLPFVALAGGLLVHGHVAFAFFVPVLALIAIVAYVRRHTSIRAAFTSDKWSAWIAAGVLFTFLFPIAVNLVFNWPGELDEYLDYSLYDDRPSNTLNEGVEYVLQYWTPPGQGGLVAAWALVVGALGIASATPPGVLRRFLFGCMAIVATSTALMLFYAVKGVDALHEAYIGYFYWAAPLLTMLVAVVGTVLLAARSRRARWLTVGGALAALLAAGRGPGLINSEPGDPHVAPAVRAMLALRESPGQPLVLEFEHAAWPDAVGALVYADRRDVRVCLADPAWAFMFTDDFICRASEVRSGARFTLKTPGSTHEPSVAIMSRSVVLAG